MVMRASARIGIVSTLAVLAGILLPARPAGAQALGYGIAGPAGYSGFFGTSAPAVHAAGGGEVLVGGWSGGQVGGGGEFGLLASTGGGLFITSANAVVHFRPSQPTPVRSRLSPFVTGGYTRMSSGEGAFNGWNAGAGTDVWLKPRVGLRIEFRDHVRSDGRGSVQYWALRAGVVFR
jgi:hypothetical protein